MTIITHSSAGVQPNKWCYVLLFVIITTMDVLERLKRWWNENDGCAVLVGTAVTALVTYYCRADIIHI